MSRQSRHLGRQGFAVWAGVGLIGREIGDLIGYRLPNAGAGNRLEVQPRRNLRLDVRWVYGEIGLYLGFNETF